MHAFKAVILGGAAVTLSGCVAAVPLAPTYTVVPGQGKTEANLRADDTTCRGSVPVSTAAGSVGTTAQVAPVTAEQYYGCMASRGEAVIQEQPQAYPVYAAAVPYAYPAYAAYPYGYGYPYGGYGYGYPYAGGYFGPYVGFGVGFGYGGFYGGRGYHHGGYGFHGGGYRGYGGGFRR